MAHEHIREKAPHRLLQNVSGHAIAQILKNILNSPI